MLENHLARPIKDEELPIVQGDEDAAPRCHWCEGDVELSKCPGCGRLACVYCLDDDDRTPRECPECVGERARRARAKAEARGDELRTRAVDAIYDCLRRFTPAVPR